MRLKPVRERCDVYLEYELVHGVTNLDLLVHVELGPHEADELDVPIIIHAEKLGGVGKRVGRGDWVGAVRLNGCSKREEGAM